MWIQQESKCVCTAEDGGPYDGCEPARQKNCVWTKAWRCNWYCIPRHEVLKAWSCRPQARCPTRSCAGENDCFVPDDQYFAEVYEIGYELCSPDQKCPQKDDATTGLPIPWETADWQNCDGTDDNGNPQGCACCGVYETCKSKIVKINSKADIPSEYPYATPLPYYERPCAERKNRICQTKNCGVGSAGAKSPNLAGMLTYA